MIVNVYGVRPRTVEEDLRSLREMDPELAGPADPGA